MCHSAPIEHPGGTERRENVLGGDGDTARGGGDELPADARRRQTAAGLSDSSDVSIVPVTGGGTSV